MHNSMHSERIVITGTGAVCAAGADPENILDFVLAGRSAIAPIEQWDTKEWPIRNAGEVRLTPRELVADRKLHKLIRRTDLFGLYAAGEAIGAADIIGHRDTLDEEGARRFSDRTGVYVGSGGGTYESHYDYFPLLTEANSELPAFGRELANTVNPMWLLRTLPNNVLGHIGIRFGLKGANACITNHSVSGTLALIEATEGLRQGEGERAVAVGHDAPVEPQLVLFYHRFGLLALGDLRPFDAGRDGSVFGDGAGALVVETQAAALRRSANVIGEVLGGGYATEAEGLVAIRADGDGPARAIAGALADAQIDASDVGMIVAHGNGTPASDASEAAAIRTVFGARPPPVTAFKWAFGHLIAAAGIVDTLLALASLRRRVVPGVATLRELDPACADLPISATHQTPRSQVALIICRGFAGTNAALLIRAGQG